jgi:hypothetical protein
MLSGVSCSARASCWAVGSRGARGALAEHWSGAGWSVASIPLAGGARDAVLDAVACRAATCTAVGAYTDRTGERLALVESLAGGRWHRQSAPNTAGATVSELQSVSCASTPFCIAVGYAYAKTGPAGLLQRMALVERWDGARWIIERVAGARQLELGAVSCAAARACVLVGSRVLRNRSAVPIVAEIGRSGAWTAQPVTLPRQAGASFGALGGVSCGSSSSCMAVGSSGEDTPVALIEHWNGASWGPQSSAARLEDYVLSGVSCPAARACVAVGSSYDGRFNHPFAEQWQGSRWTTQQTPAPAQHRTGRPLAGTVFLAVSCASVRSCLAVGYTRAVSGGPPALRAFAVASTP